MTQTLPPSSGLEPDSGQDWPARLVSSWLGVLAGGCALIGGFVAVAAGPLIAFTIIGTVVLVGLFAVAAYRPIFATYAYLGTLPVIAGISAGTLVPLVRPNDALLALLLVGALLGAYLRWCRGDRTQIELHRLDIPLGVFLLLSTAWPLLSMLLRGQTPASSDLVAVLPVCKLIGIYLLVRFSVTTQAQLVRCFRLIIWPGALVAVIAILQTLHVGPVVSLLQTVWTPDSSADALGERGTTTLASPIATGDYLVICLALLICCGIWGLLHNRERLALGLLLGAGVLAAGQFSTWISAAVAGGLILWRFSTARRNSVRFLWLIPLALAVGAPALIGRLQGFTSNYGVPSSWLGRWNNLSSFYLPEFHFVNVLFGVSTNSVLPAPERWRDVIYLESGYLNLLWIGGIPLLIGFGWLSVVVLRRSRELMARPDAPAAVGAAAATLWVCWGVLLVVTVLDPHVTLRGTGDLLFTLIGITAVKFSNTEAGSGPDGGSTTGVLDRDPPGAAP